MRKTVLNQVGLMMLFFVIPFTSFAQIGPNGFNPNSVRGEQRTIYGQPIYEADVMYRTSVWRKINLREKQNKPFFAIENEITRVIMDGVEEGKLQPYNYDASPRTDGFKDPMTKEEFRGHMKYWDANFGDSINIRPGDLYLIELKEDLIFDRRRSRMYWDIQSITLVIPQGTNEETELGDFRIATFKWKDLYKYFKESYDESQKKGTFEQVRAHWYNPENPRRHMSLADAFELRLFSSRITKISNPDDKDIVTIINDEYGDDPDAGRKILYMSQKIEYDLVEYEHNLWEF